MHSNHALDVVTWGISRITMGQELHALAIMIKDVVSTITAKHKHTGGHCGCTVAQLRNELDCDIKELRMALNSLFKTGVIKISKGANGKMVKLKI